MRKIEYIEEMGQHYYQCVIEVNKMELVDPAIFVNISNSKMIINRRRPIKKALISKIYMN